MPKPEPPRNLEDRFIDNVSRYPFYLATVLIGGIWVGVRPFAKLYQKDPLSGSVVIIGALLGLIFIHLTLRGMSGDTFLPQWVLNRFS
jgi:hypothetical protein